MTNKKKEDKPESGKIYSLTGGHGVPCIANGNTWAESEYKTDEQIAKAVDLDVSDFSDDGADIDELRNIMEGGI